MRQRNLTNDLIAYMTPARRQPEPEARRRVPRWRSLAAQRPDMLALWHPTRNGDLDPWTIGPTSSAFRPWWRCPKCAHEWLQAVNDRARPGARCPACARERST
jgi:hypothetical protein